MPFRIGGEPTGPFLFSESTLNLTRTETVSLFDAPDGTERSNPIVFATDIVFESNPINGVIYEMGASAVGAWVGLRDGGTVLRVRAGDGQSKNQSDTGTALVNITNFPQDDQVHNLMWEFVVNPGRVRVFIDGVLVGQSTTTDLSSLFNNLWAGTASGGFLLHSGFGVSGEPTDSYAAAVGNETLRIYAQQNFPDEAGPSIPTYTAKLGDKPLVGVLIGDKPIITTKTETPTTSVSTATETSVSFDITNNDNQPGIVEWEIREDSTTGTIVASDTEPIAAFATVNVEATNLNEEFYFLTNVFVTADGRLKSEQGEDRIGTKGFPEPSDLGPGPQTLLAGDLTNAGFFGTTTQTEFGRTMTQIMSDLGITQGNAQFTTDPLLKFVHRGKIKYINQRTIRSGATWDHIQARLVANGGNVYSGATLTFGGNSYRVRLMRGWGQVSANTDGTGTPNYETGPLMTISLGTGSFADGVNWPNNESPWNAPSPNEWNTLIFPIAEVTQNQTANVPNWASYPNTDLQIDSGNGSSTWVQETVNTSTSSRIARGSVNLQWIATVASNNTSSSMGLRLVFELI